MARKIVSFKHIPGSMDDFKYLINNKPENPELIEQVGMLPNNGLTTLFYSIDDEHVVVQENDPKYEQKVYDVTNEADCAVLKKVYDSNFDLQTKLNDMEISFMKNVNTFKIYRAIVRNDKEIIDKIFELEEKQDEFLKNLGFPGASIL